MGVCPLAPGRDVEPTSPVGATFTIATMSRPGSPLAIVASLAIVGAVILAGTGSVLAASHDIAIVDFEFQPPQLTVLVGEPVTWTNNSTRNHTVTSDQGAELDGNPVLPGESYGHVFEVPGTYTYHCEIYPDLMKGTIVVQAATATPVPSGSPEPTPPPGNLPSGFVPFPSVGSVASSPPPAASATPTAIPSPGDTAGGDTLLVVLTFVGVVVLGGIALILILALRRGRTPG